ncbi:helix-turn-helix domain-containing protein [Microbacterium sp. STN6]|uniref:winged helix-turn-helix transcriptional regulator n=1 Tax=Microbacterium sp. STN6 TaxID=2995588 RepID=UPI002260D431|nr:helix-turn-helix domain-containing protein [Microbacterium sp. STN6]MCX7522544.1 helix-turn-helix domain-containing protein [Microbacterium sp. STN6]
MKVVTPDAAITCDAALVAAFSVLGKRWNGLLLAALAGGSASFSELRRSLGGISDTVLSERLSELTHCELISRTVDDGPPVAVRYELTDRGLALMPALNELIAWSRENLAQPEVR